MLHHSAASRFIHADTGLSDVAYRRGIAAGIATPDLERHDPAAGCAAAAPRHGDARWLAGKTLEVAERTLDIREGVIGLVLLDDVPVDAG